MHYLRLVSINDGIILLYFILFLFYLIFDFVECVVFNACECLAAVAIGTPLGGMARFGSISVLVLAFTVEDFAGVLQITHPLVAIVVFGRNTLLTGKRRFS